MEPCILFALQDVLGATEHSALDAVVDADEKRAILRLGCRDPVFCRDGSYESVMWPLRARLKRLRRPERGACRRAVVRYVEAHQHERMKSHIYAAFGF
jgi:hypothetical protein